jgi:hypothetical protein
MMPTRWAALSTSLLGALLLAACVTPEPSVPPEVSLDGQVCAARPELAGARLVPFEAGKSAVAELGDGACFEAKDGARSSYAVFQLPIVAEPYLLRVTSVPLGQTILSPRLLLLDAGGKLLRERARDAFLFQGAALYTALRAHPNERYLVVASDPATVGREVPHLAGTVHQNIASAGLVTFFYYTGDEQKRTLVYAHNGKVTVSAQPLPKAD